MKIPPIPPALEKADPNKIHINPIISWIVIGKNGLWEHIFSSQSFKYIHWVLFKHFMFLVKVTYTENWCGCRDEENVPSKIKMREKIKTFIIINVKCNN